MALTLADLAPLLPLIILSAGAVGCLLAAAFVRGSSAVLVTAVLTLTAAFASVGRTLFLPPAWIAGLFIVDGMGSLATGLILFASLSILLLSRPYFALHGAWFAEFPVLLLFATAGGVVLVMSSHLASLMIGIELIGIPLVVMAAYRTGHHPGLEAGFKYLILAGISSAVLFFGMALLYASSGSLAYGPVTASLRLLHGQPAVFSLGAILLLAGLAFKLALVPFHFWAPDVYEGAPAPVTMFAATVSKAAVITLLLRLFPPPVVEQDRVLFAVFALLSIASMTAGNLLAVAQRNVKRMLAFSSIAHSGYILVGFLSGVPLAGPGILVYLVSYLITNVAAFGVIVVLSRQEGDAADLDRFAGLAWRRPWIAMVLTLSLLSLIGIPVTAGFIAKYSVASASMGSGHLLPVIALLLNSAISAFYYIRVVMTMFLQHEEVIGASGLLGSSRLPVIGSAVVTVSAALVVLFGTMPQYLIDLIRELMR